MTKIESILGRLSHRLRVALAASAAERVLPVYRGNYDADTDVFQAALDLVWEYAEGGGVEPQDLRALREQAEARIPSVDIDVEFIPAMNAGVTVLYALDSITDAGHQSVLSALLSAIEAAASFADDADQAERRELRWIDKALKLSQKWNDKPIKRGMFANP
jgi:uncharacterized protein YjaG (DUF416 family)